MNEQNEPAPTALDPSQRADHPADRVLLIERVFDAPPSLVFAVWSKPEHLVNWWGPKDFTLPHCITDFRVGGEYRFCMRAPDGIDHWVWGKYIEIVEPDRIVFTWEREDENGHAKQSTIVTVTFENADGKTRFRLHHAVFGTTFDRDDHRHGWGECLDRLAAYVSTGRV